MTDHRLFRHLLLAVLLKLALLATLWWLFVRDARVSVDAERVAARIGATPPQQGEAK